MGLEIKTRVYIRPDWDLAGGDFEAPWADLIGSENTFFPKPPARHAVLNDKSVAYLVDKPEEGLALARAVEGFLRKKTRLQSLPVFLFLDAAASVGAETVDIEPVEVDWAELDSGEIYVSRAVLNTMEDPSDVKVEPDPQAQPHRRFYRVILDPDSDQSNTVRFQFAHALVEGPLAPCYYCGSKAHESAKCPSKQLRYGLGAVEKLGHFCFQDINQAFSDYLETNKMPGRPPGGVAAGRGNAVPLAHRAFLETKSVFQLPFFKNIWDAPDQKWEKVKKAKAKRRKKGGVVWMGTDCLRVSNFSRAASFLDIALERHADDYRPYCALGFLNVERDEFLTARYHFLKALDLTRTKPQRMFILFLISRLYDLEGYPEEAAEKIREIRRLDPDCGEAIYQEILFEFRQGKASKAVPALVGLIEADRRYFVQALIDPDLARYADVVFPELERLFVRSRNQANALVKEAKRELGKWELLTDPGEDHGPRSSWEHVTGLLREESYFGYLDSVYHAKTLIAQLRRDIEAQKKSLLERLCGLSRRADGFLEYLRRYRFRGLIGSTYRDLIAVRNRIAEAREMATSEIPERFKRGREMPEALSRRLDDISQKLSRLDTIALAAEFFAQFLKKSMILALGAVLVAVVLFPVTIHYANLILPKFRISPIRNLWRYQEWILVVGGICATGLSLIRTIQRLMKHRGRTS